MLLHIECRSHAESKILSADLGQASFVQLFNVADDLHEDRNLAAKHPERVTEMVTLLRQQIIKGRSTFGPKLENRRGINIFQRLLGFVREQLR